jgi:hypothetical protein
MPGAMYRDALREQDRWEHPGELSIVVTEGRILHVNEVGANLIDGLANDGELANLPGAHER